MGKLYVVATPIGNVEDLSPRAQRILSEVTWIAAEDTRHSQGLLTHLGISTPLLAFHDHNERERTQSLLERIQQGESGALISDAGTPLISDPGYILISQAHALGIPVVPIPGPSAVVTALSACGLPTDSFLFAGFLPAKTHARCERLQTLGANTYSVVLYEAPHRIVDLLTDCVAVLGPERPACIARELTKKFESIKLSTVSDLLAQLNAGQIPCKGEFVVIIAGKPESNESEDDKEIDRVLTILLPQMPLKQAVLITTQLTGLAKNKIYDRAMALKSS